MRGLAGGLEGGGALLLLVGHPLPRLGGGVQGAYEIGGGRGACGEGGGRVSLRLPDRHGDPGGAVRGGPVAQDRLGGLPGGVQGAGVAQFPALGRRALLRGGQGQRGVPVGQLRGDQGFPPARGLGLRDRVGGGGDLLGELRGAATFLGGAGGEPAGEGAGAALGTGVDVAAARPRGGGLDDPAEQVDGSGGEVAFGGELGAAAELVAETADEIGQAVGVAGVRDGPQQQVGEVGVLLDREESGRLSLVGVHLTLVAEEFGIETEVAQVFVPPVVDLLPVDVEVLVELPGVHEGVTEALHGAAPSWRPIPPRWGGPPRWLRRPEGCRGRVRGRGGRSTRPRRTCGGRWRPDGHAIR